MTTATQPIGTQAQHDPEQLGIALDCTYEAESILLHVLTYQADDQDAAWIKAFVLRLKTLNSVSMSALSGRSFDSTEHMRKKLEGC